MIPYDLGLGVRNSSKGRAWRQGDAPRTHARWLELISIDPSSERLALGEAMWRLGEKAARGSCRRSRSRSQAPQGHEQGAAR